MDIFSTHNRNVFQNQVQKCVAPTSSNESVRVETRLRVQSGSDRELQPPISLSMSKVQRRRQVRERVLLAFGRQSVSCCRDRAVPLSAEKTQISFSLMSLARIQPGLNILSISRLSHLDRRFELYRHQKKRGLPKSLLLFLSLSISIYLSLSLSLFLTKTGDYPGAAVAIARGVKRNGETSHTIVLSLCLFLCMCACVCLCLQTLARLSSLLRCSHHTPSILVNHLT